MKLMLFKPILSRRRLFFFVILKESEWYCFLQLLFTSDFKIVPFYSVLICMYHFVLSAFFCKLHIFQATILVVVQVLAVHVLWAPHAITLPHLQFHALQDITGQRAVMG